MTNQSFRQRMSRSWLFSACCDEITKERELVYEDGSVIDIQIYDTLPMNIKQCNYQQIISDCKKNKKQFIDPMFPPSSRSLGQFKNIPRKLGWKRISEIVDTPCIYSSKNNPADSIMTVTSSSSYMKATLISLALKPQKIYSIFNNQKQASIYGVYKLRVKYQGVLQWMVIDDYVPIFQDTKKPLLCGTINNQIWVMLIFKAWAKICGSYSAIQGEDCFTALNAFSSGPCYSYILHPSLHQDKEALAEIFQNFKSANSICVSTTNNPKCHLKPDFDYVVRKFRAGMVDLIGEGLDQKVSHKVTLDDFFMNCVEMNVSKFESNCINTEEKQLILKYNRPFFMKYELRQPFTLTFSFWKEGKDNMQDFMRVIVARRIGNNNFQYVASKLQAFYQQMYIECPQVNAGNYYIMLMLNGPTQYNAEVKFVCYKKMRGQLTNIEFKTCNEKEVSFEPFVKSVLYNFSQNAKRSTIRQLAPSGSIMKYDELYRKGGLGYVTIKAGNKPNFSYLRLRINKKYELRQLREISQSKYQLLQKIGDEVAIHPLSELTIIYVLRSVSNKENIKTNFPPGISVMEIF